VVVPGTLYERLGVERDADAFTLRAAYRRLARLLHPDVAGDHADGIDMALVNEAWWVLSDPERRRTYDLSLPHVPGPPRSPGRRGPGTAPPGAASRAAAAPGATRTRTGGGPHGAGGGSGATTAPGRAGEAHGGPSGTPPGAGGAGSPDERPGPSIGARREAWLASLRLQILRLGNQAARSAVQTLAVRHRGVPRERYERLVEPVVRQLLADTGERVREARSAGAAPLDLAIGAALIGLRCYAAQLLVEARRRPSQGGELATVGEMVDRMWDTMAHEIPRELELALGGNPRVARRLR
jgi:curved DNA-binding protein CbpA